MNRCGRDGAHPVHGEGRIRSCDCGRVTQYRHAPDEPVLTDQEARDALDRSRPKES